MKRQRILMGLLVLAILLLAAVVGLTYAQGPEPPRPLAPQVALGTGFTYQGRLESGGEPVDGDCDIAFRLYDQSGGGSELGAVTHTLPISDGLFTVALDFGSGVFAGDSRWLGIRVMCPTDVLYTDLDRQPLSAAPYAQYSLSAGALQGNPVTTTTPALGEVLEWDGSWWAPAMDDGATDTNTQCDDETCSQLRLDDDGDVDNVLDTAAAPGVADALYWGNTQVDTDVSDDLTATTAFGGDVQGTYDNLSLETSAITPTHLNGITGSGASGQVLTSDGGGGFAWQDPALEPVRQLVQDFVLASGESVSAGDVVSFLNGEVYGPSEEWGTESVFNTADTSYIAVSSLSATDFVVAYRDAGNSYYGTAITGMVSGGTVSWGTESVFNAAFTSYVAISSLSASDFVVAYQDGGNSYHGTAITGTVSGGTVSWGTESVFNAAITSYIAVSSLSASDFVVAYQDGGNSYHGTAITGTVSGGTVSWGTESVFNAANTANIAISSISASDFVVAYEDTGNSNYGTAITGTISGVALTWGAESVFNAAATGSIAVSSLSATDFVVAYWDGGNSDNGTAITGTVSGGSLSWGTESVFNAAPTFDIAISSLSATDFVVAYWDQGNSSYGTAIWGTVSGGTVSWGTESVFNAANTGYIAVSALSATDFVVAYRDLGNSAYGTAIVRINKGRLIGTAKTAASGGETVTVIISGVSDVHSGLVPGEMYYLQADMSLGLTPTAHRIGLAISATELILDQLW